MNHLLELLEGSGLRGRLDLAALDIATIQFPGLDPQPVLDELNELASRLGDRLRNFNDGREYVEKAQSYLFEELGFHGNVENFSDPSNSCLNQVLARRKGIPITLSVLYMEISRRLQMPVFGIGLPRHFVVQFDDGNYSAYINPYGGKVVSPEDCYSLAGASFADPSLLRRVTKKQIAMRMLNNLHIVYTQHRDYPKAIQTLDLMLKGAPHQTAWYKHRGLLLAEDQHYTDARKDLERYLEAHPFADDREEVERHIARVQRLLARIN